MIFLLMQGWSDFAVCGDRRECKTLVLGEITNLWLVVKYITISVKG